MLTSYLRRPLWSWIRELSRKVQDIKVHTRIRPQRTRFCARPPRRARSNPDAQHASPQRAALASPPATRALRSNHRWFNLEWEDRRTLWDIVVQKTTRVTNLSNLMPCTFQTTDRLSRLTDKQTGIWANQKGSTCNGIGMEYGLVPNHKRKCFGSL